MDELLALRHCLEVGDIPGAIALVDDLAEMSRSDKLNKIDRYGFILRLPLLKRQAAQRLIRSWEGSIRQAVRAIHKVKRRRGGTYFPLAALREVLVKGYPTALARAALAAFEGRYTATELAQRVDQTTMLAQATDLLRATV